VTSALFVGDQGSGLYDLRGGRLTVGSELVVGRFSTGSNVFLLSDAGEISARTETIGLFGTGTFTQTGGQNVVSGVLKVGPDIRSKYVLQGGQLTTETLVVENPPTFDFSGGRLAVGSITGYVTNDGGILSPGTAQGPSTVPVNGAYVINSPAAVLQMEIGGVLFGTYDRLDISNQSVLGGLLDVSLYNGFTPSPGDTFDILTATTIVGTFDVVSFPSFNGRTFGISYLLDPSGTDIVRLTVEAVPEPTSAVLIGTCILVLGTMVRWRRLRSS